MERLQSECSCQLNDRTHITYTVYTYVPPRIHAFTPCHYLFLLFLSFFLLVARSLNLFGTPDLAVLHCTPFLHYDLLPFLLLVPDIIIPVHVSTHKRADVYTRDAPREVFSDSANYPDKVTYNFQSSNYSLQRSTVLAKHFFYH